MEAIHQMRVASRRLRASIALFSGILPRGVAPGLETRARSVTRALRRARDADVALLHFAGWWRDSTHPEERLALEHLLERLERRRKRRRRQARNALARLRVERWLPSFRRALSTGPSKESRTVSSPARRVLLQRLRTVLVARDRARHRRDARTLHALRVAIKKLRYTAEILPLGPADRAKENQRLLRRAQGALGRLHDRDVFQELIRRRIRRLEQGRFGKNLAATCRKLETRLARERNEILKECQRLLHALPLAGWIARLTRNQSIPFDNPVSAPDGRPWRR